MSFMGKNYTKGFKKDNIDAPIPPRVQALPRSHRIYIDGVNGNDKNDGTSANPIKTLDTFFDICHHEQMDIRAYIVRSGTYTASYQSYTSIACHITANVDGVTLNFTSAAGGNIAFYQCHVNLQTADPENMKMNVQVTGSSDTNHIYFDSGSIWIRGIDFKNPIYTYGGTGLIEHCILRRGVWNFWGNLKLAQNEYHYNNCNVLHGESGDFLISGARTKFVIDSNSGDTQIADLHGGRLQLDVSIDPEDITGTKLTKTSQEWYFNNAIINATQARLDTLQNVSTKINQSYIDGGGSSRLNHCLLGPATSFKD